MSDAFLGRTRSEAHNPAFSKMRRWHRCLSRSGRIRPDVLGEPAPRTWRPSSRPRPDLTHGSTPLEESASPRARAQPRRGAQTTSRTRRGYQRAAERCARGVSTPPPPRGGGSRPRQRPRPHWPHRWKDERARARAAAKGHGARGRPGLEKIRPCSGEGGRSIRRQSLLLAHLGSARPLLRTKARYLAPSRCILDVARSCEAAEPISARRRSHVAHVPTSVGAALGSSAEARLGARRCAPRSGARVFRKVSEAWGAPGPSHGAILRILGPPNLGPPIDTRVETPELLPDPTAQIAAVLREAVGAKVQRRDRGAMGRVAEGLQTGSRAQPGHLECGDPTRGPAIPWSAEVAEWSLLVWADILFVVSASWDDAWARARASEALAKIHLFFSAGSLQAMGNRAAGPPADATGRWQLWGD